MNSELEQYLKGEIAQRQAVNLPAGIGGIPVGAQVHIHYHEAPQVVAQADPARRTTRDDGLLAWFMPYFVIGLLSFILVGGVVGLIMALAVVMIGLVVTLVQALAVGLLLAGASALIAGIGVQKMRAGKEQTEK